MALTGEELFLGTEKVMATNQRLPVLVNLETNDRFPLNGPVNTIGRAPDNTVVLTDEWCSANHARIYFHEGRWLLEDLQSSNGTSVNERMLDGPQQLSPNDLIKVGHTTLRIE
jgi:pSer/pThr/pTyr-binding forkhead associated (FHA) protein